MNDTHAPGHTAVPSASLPSRVIGVLLSPRETFAAVAARPRWFGILALTTLVIALSTGWLLSTEVGAQAWLDQAVRSRESFGAQVSDEQYRGMERMLPYAGYFAVAQFLVMMPVVALVVAGIVFAVFNAVLGGEASFTQVFAVVAHAGVVSVVQQLFVTPLNYFRESLSSPANLAVFLPMLDETSFVARLTGMVDLFIVWWTIVLAIGIAVLYRRRTQPIAWSFFAVYAIIALTIASIQSALGGPSS